MMMNWMRSEPSSAVSNLRRGGLQQRPSTLVSAMTLPTGVARTTISAVEQSYLPVGLSSKSTNLTVVNNGLTFTNNGARTVSVHKTLGSATWDTVVFTPTQLVAPVTIEYTKTAPASDNSTAYSMIGFTTSATPNTSYNDISYCAYQYATNVWEVYHNGNSIGNQGSWSTGSRNYITYTANGTIRHYNGATQKYSVAWTAGNTVYLKIAFYAVNATSGFSDIRIIPKEWNGTTYL